MMAIKHWCNHPDKVLSILCRGIVDRNLLKIKYYSEPVIEELLEEKINEAIIKTSMNKDDLQWLIFTGEASSRTYNFENEKIRILFKDGTVKDISEVDNALINENLKGKVKKYYICYLR